MRFRLLLCSAVLTSACRHSAPAPTPGPDPLPASIPPLVGVEQVVMALRYIDARAGTGAAVRTGQCAFVHYTGWLRDGTKFDSSRDTAANGTPRTPIAFAVGYRRVISGWDLGVEGMTVGSQRRLFIPYPFAYGEAGRPPVIPPKAELIFDVELMTAADTLPRTDGAPPRGSAPQCPTWTAVKDQPAR